MFEPFPTPEAAARWVQIIIQATRSGDILWESNGEGGFIEQGYEDAVSWHLFVLSPRKLALRATTEEHDLVVSEVNNPVHGEALAALESAIKEQLQIAA